MYPCTYAIMKRRPVGKYSNPENILDVKLFEMNKTKLSLPGKTLLLMSKNLSTTALCIHIYIWGYVCLCICIYFYEHIYLYTYMNMKRRSVAKYSEWEKILYGRMFEMGSWICLYRAKTSRWCQNCSAQRLYIAAVITRIYMCVSVYLCTYKCVQMCGWMYTYTYMRLYIFRYICVSLFMYMSIYTCEYEKVQFCWKIFKWENHSFFMIRLHDGFMAVDHFQLVYIYMNIVISFSTYISICIPKFCFCICICILWFESLCDVNAQMCVENKRSTALTCCEC